MLRFVFFGWMALSIQLQAQSPRPFETQVVSPRLYEHWSQEKTVESGAPLANEVQTFSEVQVLQQGPISTLSILGRPSHQVQVLFYGFRLRDDTSPTGALDISDLFVLPNSTIRLESNPFVAKWGGAAGGGLLEVSEEPQVLIGPFSFSQKFDSNGSHQSLLSGRNPTQAGALQLAKSLEANRFVDSGALTENGRQSQAGYFRKRKGNWSFLAFFREGYRDFDRLDAPDPNARSFFSWRAFAAKHKAENSEVQLAWQGSKRSELNLQDTFSSLEFDEQYLADRFSVAGTFHQNWNFDWQRVQVSSEAAGMSVAAFNAASLGRLFAQPLSPHWNLESGLRIQSSNWEERHNLDVQGSLALSKSDRGVAESDFKLQMDRYTTEPSAYQLYSLYGNKALKAEDNLNLHLSWQFLTSSNKRLGFLLFHWWQKDSIQFETENSRYKNLSERRIQGASSFLQGEKFKLSAMALEPDRTELFLFRTRYQLLCELELLGIWIFRSEWGARSKSKDLPQRARLDYRWTRHWDQRQSLSFTIQDLTNSFRTYEAIAQVPEKRLYSLEFSLQW